ncbi:MAG: Rpp14/Pop5 family protein [Zestosphaera sp.]
MPDSTSLYEAVALAVALTALTLSLLALLRVKSLSHKSELFLSSLTSRTIRHVVEKLKGRKKRGKRYLIVRLVGASDDLDCSKLQRYIDEAFIELYGKVSYSKASPRVLYINRDSSKAIIRVRTPYKWEVLTVMGILERNGVVKSVIPERSTGTYRKARKHVEIP